MSYRINVDGDNVGAGFYVTIDDQRGLERVIRKSEDLEERRGDGAGEEASYGSDAEDDSERDVRIELWRMQELGDEFIGGGWIELDAPLDDAMAVQLLDTEGEEVKELMVKVSRVAASSDARLDEEAEASPNATEEGGGLEGQGDAAVAEIVDQLLARIEAGSATDARRALALLARHAGASRGIQAKFFQALDPRGLQTIVWQLEYADVKLSKAVHKLMRVLVAGEPAHVVRLARACDCPGVVASSRFFYYIPHATLREVFASAHPDALCEEDYDSFVEQFIRENGPDIGAPSLEIPDAATREALCEQVAQKSTSLAFRLVKLFARYHELVQAGVAPEDIPDDPFICSYVTLPPGSRIATWPDLRQRFFFQHYQLRNVTASSLQEDVVLLDDFACGLDGKAARVSIINTRSVALSRIRVRASIAEAELSPTGSESDGSKDARAIFGAEVDVGTTRDPLGLADEELVAIVHRCTLGILPESKTADSEAAILLERIASPKRTSNKPEKGKGRGAKSGSCPRKALVAAMPQIAQLWNQGDRTAAGELLVEHGKPMISHLAGQPELRADLGEAIKRVRLHPQNPRHILHLWHTCQGLACEVDHKADLASAMTLVAELWNQRDREGAGKVLVEKSTPLVAQLEGQRALRARLADDIKRVRVKPKNARVVMSLWNSCEAVLREMNRAKTHHQPDRRLSSALVQANRARREAEHGQERKKRTEAFESSVARHRAREREKMEHQHALVFQREQESRKLRQQRDDEAAEIAREEAAWYREETRLLEVEKKMQRKELEREARRRAIAKKRNDQAIEDQRKRLLAEEKRAAAEQERRRREYEARAKRRASTKKTQATKKSARGSKISRELHLEPPPASALCRACSPRVAPSLRAKNEDKSLYEQVDWAAVCDWPDLPHFTESP